MANATRLLVDGMCGLMILRYFNKFDSKHIGELRSRGYDYVDCDAPSDNALHKVSKRGTGFYGAGFVNTEACKKVYEELTKSYKLVVQLPVRLNENSQNQFFFAIFDIEGKDDMPALEGKWPW